MNERVLREIAVATRRLIDALWAEASRPSQLGLTLTTSIPEQRHVRARAERLRVDVENPPTAPTTG